ncbi:MAG TPA: NAD(+)/NADH kinase [Candidatus Krumholzibacteria bacterium]|nr:NAD(+)/NADH kinase [Candidatus Krumholzibacteria bacterium]
MIPANIRSVGIAANLEKEGAREIVRAMAASLTAAGVRVYVDDDLATMAPSLPGVAAGIPEQCDLLVAIGGDGTILKYARRYVDRTTPLVGVKCGRLGFLAESHPDRVMRLLNDGAFCIQNRMRILCTVKHDGIPARSFTALNDVVVHSTGYSRMVRLRVEVGGNLLREFSADGLIVATPTGSTAYSLSAGGAIVEPTLEAIVLTPLNPHTMSMRPMVLDASETVRIQVTDAPSGVIATVDGQLGMEFDGSSEVTVRRDTRPTRLVVGTDYDFFALLREKL